MKTVVKMFKPEFAELVRNGKKLQTIRPTPKRMPEVGDVDWREISHNWRSGLSCPGGRVSGSVRDAGVVRAGAWFSV